MPIHDFSFNQPGPKNLQEQVSIPRANGGAIELIPVSVDPVKVPDRDKKDDIFFENLNVNVAEDVSEILPKGFFTLDRGMKNYFSGIRIPTTDSYRMMNARVAGGDKTFLIWNQDLRHGRVTLPVLSINRTSYNYWPEKFSPPHHYMRRRFIDRSGSRVATTFRPVPYLVEYTLTVWAEHKTDAEYATYQITTRFNPLAEFIVEDEHLRQNVILRFNGSNDNSDKDVDAETRPNVRYDFNITAEYAVPLPEKLLPTILGRVSNIKEQVTGALLQNTTGIDAVPIT